jgi:arylsulfatase A-like enzyme
MKAIVLIIRGLQHSALGCYGNQWIYTPALDALASAGAVFDQHFADNADSAGVRRAWRSGRYQFPANISAANAGMQPGLLTVLQEKGIHTCLVLDDSRLSPAEFLAGWHTVERVRAAEEEVPLEATLERVGAALEKLERLDNWLLWIDLATLLPPWSVPAEIQEAYFNEEPDDEAEDDEDEEMEESEPLTPISDVATGPIDRDDDYLYLSLQTSYAAAVSYVDTAIGQLLEALDGLEGGDDILFLLTTDTGQNLGEHGIVGTCRAWLHDELIHLPLVIRVPGVDAGRRIAALTQAVDLAPTLADWFHVPLVEVHGRSLLPLVRGEIESIRPFACAALQVGESIEYALRTPEWAFLLPVKTGVDDADRSPQLFVKPDDRCEVNNVLQHHLELAEQLERMLRDFVSASN